MQDSERNVIRGRLEQRLAQLTRRAGKIGTDLRRPQNPDSEERATETENDEVLESLVIGQQQDGDVRVVLFVRLRDSLYSVSLCGSVNARTATFSMSVIECFSPMNSQKLASIYQKSLLIPGHF